MNLPHVGVAWIEIQPTYNDLVIATSGRGFYILDDYTALGHLTPETLAKPAALFAPRKTYVYQQKTRDAPGAFTTPNPPFGALLTYWVRDPNAAGGKVVVRVTDAAGKVMGQMDAPDSPGLHRVSWNLRADGLVPPGKYQVTLARMTGGTMTPLDQPRELEVVPLPTGQ